MKTRTLLWMVLGLVSVLIVGVVIVVTLLVGQNEQAAYERCLQANGIDLSEAADDVEGLAEAAAACAD